MRIGFNWEDANKVENIYSNFIGCPGHYSVGAVGATGVLKEINFKEGYMTVQPSIVGYGEFARLEKDKPTLIIMAPGSPLAIRPLKEGDLLKILEDHKKYPDRKDDKIH